MTRSTKLSMSKKSKCVDSNKEGKRDPTWFLNSSTFSKPHSSTWGLRILLDMKTISTRRIKTTTIPSINVVKVSKFTFKYKSVTCVLTDIKNEHSMKKMIAAEVKT